MRFHRTFMFCAAAALASTGCEVHEHDRGPAALQGEVTVDEPQGEVIEAPGVTAIDVEPDPAQRVYVYDEGYPPGTYVYDNYYYYGGYRYPRDVFVNRYVQENIRRHRYVNVEENRREGQRLEQRHREEFSKTHGMRQRPAGRSEAQPRGQVPVRQPEAARPNVERPEYRAPANEERRTVQQPANRAPANEERRETERPAGPAPANERRTDVAHPENRAAPAREPSRQNQEEQKREEQKREEGK